MSTPLFLFKIPAGIAKPASAEEFGNRFDYGDLVAPTPASIEADFRRVLPDFRWDGHHLSTTYDGDGVTLEIRVVKRGLHVEASEAGWRVLREPAASTQWVVLDPSTVSLL